MYAPSKKKMQIHFQIDASTWIASISMENFSLAMDLFRMKHSNFEWFFVIDSLNKAKIIVNDQTLWGFALELIETNKQKTKFESKLELRNLSLTLKSSK